MNKSSFVEVAFKEIGENFVIYIIKETNNVSFYESGNPFSTSDRSKSSMTSPLWSKTVGGI
jgi:hypothetical protein